MACCLRLAGVLSLAVVCFLGGAPAAFAQATYTWNSNADGSWNTAGNWSDPVIPNGQGIGVIFGNAITANRTVTVDSPVSVGNITFQDAAFSYSLGGNAFLTLDNGTSPAVITVASSVTANQTLGTTINALSDVVVTNNSSSILKIAGVNLGAHTFTVNGSGTVSNIGNGFFGSAGSQVVVNGPGALRLESNFNSGVKYVVNGGTLVAANNNAIRADSFTADLVTINNNATLRFESNQSQSDRIGIVLGAGGGRIESTIASPFSAEIKGVISGSGSLTKIGTGMLSMQAAQTYTGDTVIRDGILRLDVHAPSGAAGALGNATSAVVLGDNVGANSTALLTGGTTSVTVARDITVVASAAPGTSTVTIGGNGSTSSSAVFSGTLTLNRSVILTTGSSSPTVSYARITGTGGVTVAGGGVTTFTSSASDFTGTITIGAGALPNLVQGMLAVSADAQLGAASNSLFFYGGTLRVTGASPFSTSRGITLGYINGVQASGVIDVSDAANNFTILSPITGDGPFRKVGPGVLTLGGANANGYTTFVEQGTLRTSAAGVLAAGSHLSITSGATVQLNGFSQTVRGLSNPGSTGGTIDLGSTAGTVLTLNQHFGGTPTLFKGNINGTGDLVKIGLGNQQLGGGGNFVGTTTVRQGILELTTFVPASGNGPLGSSLGGAIRLGDANFSSMDAALLSTDTTISGFGRPITVVAGSGYRTIGHQVTGSDNSGTTVAFSGPITLEKDLQLFTKFDGNNIHRFQVSGVISGGGGLVKIGAGEATLAADNTYTGTTTVNNGQLIIGGQSLPDAAARFSSGFVVRTEWKDTLGPSFNPTIFLSGVTTPELAIHDFSPNFNRIGDVDVTLVHGKFLYWGQSSGASSESFRNLVLERGPNVLTIETPSNANLTSATLSMTGGLVRNNSSTLLAVSADTLGKPDGVDYTRVLTTTTPTLLGGGGGPGSTNISIIPWAYHDNNPNGGAATSVETFLTYGSTGLRPLADTEYVTSLIAAGTLNNVRLTTANVSLTQNQTINSLRYGLSANGTITLTNQKLTIHSGAILSTGGLLTFTGGEIAFGSAEGIIHTTSLGNVTINSVISGSGGLTSAVANNLTLNGANTYTGPTTINSGGVAFNSAASFGSGGGPIRFLNAVNSALSYSGSGATTLPNAITISGGSMWFYVTDGGTLTLDGVISGVEPVGSVSGPLFDAKTGVIQLRGANTFTSPLVQLVSGTIGINSDNNFGAASNRLYLGSTTTSPTLRFDAAGITIARQIAVNNSVTIDTNGFDATISGQMLGSDNTKILTKSGTGILTLTGTQSYGATTTITGGTLRVNGTLVSSAGGVNVNNSGTLGGSGLIDRVVTVNTGGTLAPGAGVGTLTVRTLVFGASPNATFEWEAGASTHDQIMVTNGPLNLAGVQATLKLYDRGLGFNVTPEQQFPLITVAGTGSITGFNPANFTVVFADTPNWSTSQYLLSVVEMGGNTSLVLSNLSPVPEPTGVLAVAGLALGVATLRRRRATPRYGETISQIVA